MNDNVALLRALVGEGVEFTVVGGAAAVVHGAATVTYDLDLLMPFTEANCARLLRALHDLHPRLSHTPDKRALTHSAEQLASFKNLYLVTDLGRLDLLGALPPFEDPGEVHRRAVVLEIGGVRVRVISIDDLIRVKAALDRPKDRIVEAELRAVRAKLNHSGG